MSEEKASTEIWRHLNEKIIDTSNIFLRSAILINGGAAIAVLGFVASIAKADKSYIDVIVGIADAIVLFAYGTAAGVIGIALAYLTHYATLATHVNLNEARQGLFVWLKRSLHILAIAAAISTIFLFVKGTVAVKAAILSGVI
ncbi:hypothetical protein K3758_07495 [Sulfitobacter sp. W002]|uniref:hypothetical protein n=1 Tax=Sulfitobacter sp. W002 TaxID=2867024 RepID=UPI0021A66FD6|nr:hypothetical protein [Sulfitobacter sp. W002]UWR31338.1 hypothetical protein K3758_07495 [Sulfitobacter sp. W002]